MSENVRWSFRCQKPENHDNFSNDLQTVNCAEAKSGNLNDTVSYFIAQID